eukprot:COSAG01_NODE_2572_length_7436_cov_3.363500_5_plen_96_part_00
MAYSLFCPDFHVSDLEQHDFLDYDTDDKGEFVLDNNGQRIPTTALRGVVEPVIVHSHDTQRLGHIQHRTNGKNFAGSGAELCITVLNGLDGPIVL